MIARIEIQYAQESSAGGWSEGAREVHRVQGTPAMLGIRVGDLLTTADTWNYPPRKIELTLLPDPEVL